MPTPFNGRLFFSNRFNTMKQKQSLYNINENQLELYNQVMAADGELTPELEEAIALNEKNRNQKAVAYMEVVSKKKIKIQAIEEEIKRLQALKKSETNIINRLHHNLLTCVKTFGAFEVKTLKFGTRKSTTVAIEEDKINSLPEEYKKTKTTVTPDKTAIKAALNNGEEIDGCSLVENLNLKIN